MEPLKRPITVGASPNRPPMRSLERWRVGCLAECRQAFQGNLVGQTEDGLLSSLNRYPFSLNGVACWVFHEFWYFEFLVAILGNVAR